jgi:hypothetical protein
MNLLLKIIRYKSSYDFRVDQNKPDGFENNYKHNSADWLILFDESAELFRARCQTVANYCFGDNATADTVKHGDTVAPGNFQIRCFADPRAFHGEIHEIINATDLDGQRINHNAMQTTAGGFQNGRWLIHDRYSFKLGVDTNYAWSAGCFILSSTDLVRFNKALKSCGIKSGDIIPGELTEV